MKRTIVWLVSLTCWIGSSVAFAQENTAELRGNVLDGQDAAVPGVTVTITNQASGVRRQAVSNGDGTYFITAITPGVYLLEAELSGFKKYSRRDVRLDLGRTTSLDVKLDLGQLTEVVTITA